MTYDSWTDDDSSHDLDADLRADAASWRASPSPQATDRLREVVNDLPSRIPARRTGLILAAAALLLVSLAVFAVTESASADQVDAPFEQELGDLADDVNTLTDAFWQHLPAPLRRLRTS